MVGDEAAEDASCSPSRQAGWGLFPGPVPPAGLTQGSNAPTHSCRTRTSLPEARLSPVGQLDGAPRQPAAGAARHLGHRALAGLSACGHRRGLARLAGGRRVLWLGPAGGLDSGCDPLATLVLARSRRWPDCPIAWHVVARWRPARLPDAPLGKSRDAVRPGLWHLAGERPRRLGRSRLCARPGGAGPGPGERHALQGFRRPFEGARSTAAGCHLSRLRPESCRCAATHGMAAALRSPGAQSVRGPRHDERRHRAGDRRTSK